MKYKSQENAMFVAIHPTTYRGGGFLTHGVLNYKILTHEILNYKILNYKILNHKSCTGKSPAHCLLQWKQGTSFYDRINFS